MNLLIPSREHTITSQSVNRRPANDVPDEAQSERKVSCWFHANPFLFPDISSSHRSLIVRPQILRNEEG